MAMKTKHNTKLSVIVIGVVALIFALTACDSSTSETYYTVTFDANGGTFADGESTTSASVIEGSTLFNAIEEAGLFEEDGVPTRSGYEFVSWGYQDEEGVITDATWSDVLEEDVTVYAIWDEVSTPVVIPPSTGGSSTGGSGSSSDTGSSDTATDTDDGDDTPVVTEYIVSFDISAIYNITGYHGISLFSVGGYPVTYDSETGLFYVVVPVGESIPNPTLTVEFNDGVYEFRSLTVNTFDWDVEFDYTPEADVTLTIQLTENSITGTYEDNEYTLSLTWSAN